MLKGSTFLARLAYLEAKFDEDSRRRVFDALPSADVALLKGKILPGSWYPRTVFNRLVETIDQELGHGDYRLVRKMGYFAADLQLTGAYASFVRPGDPLFLLDRAGNAWTFFHDFGHMESSRDGADRGIIHLSKLGYADLVTVEGIVGWACRGLELSGCGSIRFRYDPVPGTDPGAFRIVMAWQLDLDEPEP